MKFVTFIASTMLIVLISQYSVTGLPLNDTSVEENRPKGFEKGDSLSTPISSTTSDRSGESDSLPAETVSREQQPTTEVKQEPKKFGSCPEGMEHGEHGICKEIKPSETVTTEANAESTTDSNDNKRAPINLMSCPEGTRRDDDGACQEIKPSNYTKPATDPKVLLKEDGSCPDNYKMIEERCVYVRPKTNSTLPSRTPDYNDRRGGVRPRVGNDQTSQYELVPVLPDNSCPKGTEYFEYGLCRKRPDLLNRNLKLTRFCPGDFELVGDRCLPSRSPNRPQFTTSTRMPETEQPIDHPESLKPIPDAEQPTDRPKLPKSNPDTEQPGDSNELPKSNPKTEQPIDSNESPKSNPKTEQPTDSNELPKSNPKPEQPIDSNELPKSNPKPEQPIDSNESPKSNPKTEQPIDSNELPKSNPKTEQPIDSNELPKSNPKTEQPVDSNELPKSNPKTEPITKTLPDDKAVEVAAKPLPRLRQ
jgi:hypothetical protein